MQPPQTSHPANPTKVILGMVVTCCVFGVLLQVERAEEIIALVFIPSSALHVLCAYRLQAARPPLPLFNSESPRAHMWFAATSASMALIVFAGAHLHGAVLWPLVVFGVACVFFGINAEKRARAHS